MIEIHNLTRAALGFVTGQNDDQPIVAEVLPGETKKVDLKADDPVVVARVHAQAITVTPSPKPSRRAAAE